MSIPNNIDFIKGKDFTAVASLAPADLNLLVDSAQVYTEADPLEGKGLIIVTKDTALDTPSVPDAVSVPKWKRYIWMRLPHSTATDTTPILYVWNDNAVSVATYLKWEVASDTATLAAAIDALEIEVDNLDTTVGGLSSQINLLTTRVTDAEAAANAATEATDEIPALATRVTNLEVADGLQDTAITAAQDTADQALAAASEVTAAQLADTLDLSSKTITYPDRYTGTQALPAAGGLATFTHNFGAIPMSVRAVLVCTSNDAASGYVAGDEIDVSHVNETVGNMFVSVFFDANNVYLRRSSGATIQVLHKTTGAYVAGVSSSANFGNLKCYAWK